MLESIFGNKTTEKVLLSLFHHHENYVAGIAQDFSMAENPIRAQLSRLEESGIIHSKSAGRTRLYSFNPKSPYAVPVKNLIAVLYNSIPIKDREHIFKVRRRPRRKGKPVI
jgi:predicted transcriptional regulator